MKVEGVAVLGLVKYFQVEGRSGNGSAQLWRVAFIEAFVRVLNFKMRQCWSQSFTCSFALYMINAYHVIRDMCCKTELDVSHGGSAEGREGREAQWLPWPRAVARGLSVGRGCCQSSETGLGANLVWKWAKEESAVSLPPWENGVSFFVSPQSCEVKVQFKNSHA